MKLILNQPSGSMPETRSFVEFDADGGTLGAAVDNTLVLPADDGSVSPRQARIVRTSNHWSIRNEGERFIIINGRWLESGAERPLHRNHPRLHHEPRPRRQRIILGAKQQCAPPSSQLLP